MPIKFKIVTPEKVIYENDHIEQVTAPTTTGEITILPNHTPLITILNPGELVFKEKEELHHFAVAGGFLEVRENNEIVILADNAENVDQIDIDRAQLAKERAIAQMSEIKNREDVDYARIQAVIDRETNRIRLGNKYRRLPKSE
ncbi:MAG: ATP synthase F1 subunit epsilon [Candidatus Magasanikbacteria bacterium]|jgi:F-type H+-transporting ATPase subunit epsilon